MISTSRKAKRPSSKLIFGPDGNLYGTAALGGSMPAGFPEAFGFGTLFRITTNGVFTSLVQFQGTNGSISQCVGRAWS